MRTIVLCSIPLLFFSIYAFCQQEFYNTTFGNNGQVIHDLNGYSEFGTLIKNDNSLYGLIYYWSESENQRPRILKYDLNGNIDNSFGNNGFIDPDLRIPGWMFRDVFHGFISFTSDNKLLIVTSSFARNEHITNNFIGKFHLDGTPDTSFGENGYVESLFDNSLNIFEVKKLENDHLIIVGSKHDFVNSQTNLLVIKFNNTGQLDTSFGSNGIIQFPYNDDHMNPIQFILKLEENNLYVAWNNYESDIQIDGSISKYNLETQQIDTEFGNNGIITINFNNDKKDIIHRFQVNQNGELLVVYDTPSNVNYEGSYLVKYNENQEIDTSFGIQGFSLVSDDYSVFTKRMFLNENYLFLIGEFYESKLFIKRFNLDGTNDEHFGIEGMIYRQNIINGISAENWVFDMVIEDNTIFTSGSCKKNLNSYADACIYSFVLNPDLKVEDLTTNQIIIYPNPAQEYLNIYHQDDIYKIEIFNYLGQRLIYQANNSSKININNLETGTYDLKLVDQKGRIYHKRFIKN